MPTVELLHVPGCPHGSAYLPHLRVLLAGTGARLVARTVDSAEEAERERFVGSPTVRVDGVDVEPGLTATPGLTCRLYRTGEGVAGVPPDAWIVAAIESVAGRRRP